jgi:hypothetical protein
MATRSATAARDGAELIADRMGARGRPARAAAALAICALALVAVSAATARADAPTLTVANLGQASAPSEVAQPPLGVGSRGSCPHPFSIARESACPPGTWPPLGRPSWMGEGDRWSPTEDVAGGDTLQLRFSAPMTGVAVASTSNYVPGLHDPDGKSLSNYDVIPESAASATLDPAVWQVSLPALDYRALGGYTFSVVGSDGSGIYDYSFEIRSPRFADESTRCGMAYFSTGVQQTLCFQGPFPGSYPPTHRARKPKKCRHGFRRKKIHGRARCVRVKKSDAKPHRR